VHENTTRVAAGALSRMRGIAIAVIAVVALTAAPAALAAGGLPGQYRTTIASPAQFKGAWVITFKTGGAYTVVDNGHVLVRGRYSTMGSKVTLGHETGEGACAASGTYSWKRAGTHLTFARTHDAAACVGRIGVLAHPFTLTS
jgi:hypothetical protein